MGKNQAYKAMQRARLGGTSSAVPDQIEDGMVDGSFHSPEWHAARLASLNTSHTITWEDFKKKQKEDELRKGELEADTDKMMREYRAQLDAERAHKLAHGRNHSSKKSKRKLDRKEKDSTKRSSKRKVPSTTRSRRGSSDSASSSSDSSSSSKDDDREARRSKSKRSKRKKKHGLKKADDSGDDAGPVPLSRFFQSIKS